MAEAKRDENFVTTLLAVSSVDGVTPITLYANPTTHRLLVDLAGGGGTPGGLTTQVQYNNAGVFGGITGATTNGITLTLVAPILGTPASATLTNATGLPLASGVTGTLPLVNGGTGLISIAAKSIWAANAVNTLVALTPGAGQSVRINAGNTAWEVYTPVLTGGLTWSEVTGITQAGVVNAAYVTNNAALVTVTIPDTAALGDILRIVGKGAGGWRISQNALESINFGAYTSTVGIGGYLASSNRYDSIELVCTVANTTWTVASSIGNITYV